MVFFLTTLVLLLIIYIDVRKNVAHAVFDMLISLMAISVIIAEILSSFECWNNILISILYACISVALFLYIYKKRRFIHLCEHHFSKTEYLLLSCVLLLLVYIFICGIVQEPVFPVDSILYHMIRSYMYAENQSIRCFSTSFGHMLFFGPLNSILIAQFRILTNGSDALSFLVQYSAYVLSAVTTYLICLKLGMKRVWALCGAAIALTIPLSALQATTTQNDLLVSALCLAAVCYIIEISTCLGKNCRVKLIEWLLLGFSCGLAVLTKVNAGINLLLFIIAFSVYVMYKQHLKGLLFLVFTLCCALAVVGWFWVQNTLLLNGDFLALSYAKYVSASYDMNIASYSLLALENIGSTIAVPHTFLASFVQTIVYNYADLVNVDVNMPGIVRNTGSESVLYSTNQSVFYDTCPYPIISIAVIFSVVYFIIYFGKRRNSSQKKNKTVLIYSIISAMTLLLNTVLITFSTSSTRYLLGVYLLMIPTVVFMFSKLSEKPAVGYTLFGVFIVADIIFLLYVLLKNVLKFYYNESEKANKSTPELVDEWIEFTKQIQENDSYSIGLESNVVPAPFYVFLTDLDYRTHEVKYLNPSYYMQDQNGFIPDIIISTYSDIDQFETTKVYCNQIYNMAYEPIGIWGEMYYFTYYVLVE